MEAKDTIKNLMQKMFAGAVVMDTETLGIERGIGMHEIALVELDKMGMPVTAKEILPSPNRVKLTDTYNQDVSGLRHRPGEIAAPVKQVNANRTGWNQIVTNLIAEKGHDQLSDFSQWLSRRTDLYPHLGLSSSDGVVKSDNEIRQLAASRQVGLMKSHPTMLNLTTANPLQLTAVNDIVDAEGEFFTSLKGKVVWGANVGFDCLVGDTLVETASGNIIKLADWSGEPLQGSSPEESCYRKQSTVNGVVLVEKGTKECLTLYSSHALPLTGSKKHKLFTAKGWQYLEDVAEGDWVLTSTGSSRELPDNPAYTDEEYQLLGVWLARGLRGASEFTIRKTNKKNLALLPEPYEDSMWYGVKGSPHLVTLKSKTVDLLAPIKKAGIHNQAPKNRVLPKEVMEASDRQLYHFLRGFVLSSGSIKESFQKVFWISHSNELLLRQVFLLLKRIDIACCWSIDKSLKNNKIRVSFNEINKLIWVKRKSNMSNRRFPVHLFPIDVLRDLSKEIYGVMANINGRASNGLLKSKTFDDIWLRETLMDFKEDAISKSCSPECIAKIESLSSCLPDGFYWTKVLRIESAGEHSVYDIEVDTGEFIANGLLVHNTKQLSALVAGYGSQTFDPAQMTKQQLENLKPDLSSDEYSRLMRGEVIEANVQTPRIQRMFETYTPGTKEFGYVTGVEVNQALVKAQLTGDYKGVFESYLQHTAPVKDKIVVRDIQHVMQAMFSYGRDLGLYGSKTNVTSVDVISRLIGSMDAGLEGAERHLMTPEVHRALEDALVSETPMIRRTMEMALAMREVHAGTAAGQQLQEMALEGKGAYFEAAKILGQTEKLVPDIEEVRARQRIERAAQDLTKNGYTVQMKGAARVYQRDVVNAAGQRVGMPLVENRYSSMQSMGSVIDFLENTDAYPSVDVRALEKSMRINTAGDGPAVYQAQAQEHIDEIFEKRKNELLEFMPEFGDLHGEADKIRRNLDLSAAQIRKAGMKIAVGMGGVAAVGAGLAAVGSLSKRDEETIAGFSYYDYLESQARYSGMYSQGIMDQHTFSDFGSPYRGPIQSTATLTNQTLNREEQQYRQLRSQQGNMDTLFSMRTFEKPNEMIKMAPFAIEQFMSSNTQIAQISRPLMDMGHDTQAINSISKKTAKFAMKHSLQFGSMTPPPGTGPLTTMSQEWQSYSGQMMYDLTQFTSQHAYGTRGALESSRFGVLNNSLASSYASYGHQKDVEKAMRDSLENHRARISNYGKQLKHDMAQMQRQANRYIGIRR